MNKKFGTLFVALLAMSFINNSVVARPMTETDLAMLKRLSAPALSPDGRYVVFQLRETDVENNSARNDVYVLSVDDKSATAVKIASKPDKNEHDPVFARDGRAIYYISNDSGSEQIWRYDLVNKSVTQVSNFKTEVSGFKLSPDGKMIVVWGDVARDCPQFDCDHDGNLSKRGQGSGREYDQLFVRHWDAWETPGNYSRIFTFAIDKDGKLSGNGVPLDGDVTGDSPSKPFGDGNEISWGADSKTVFFALRKADRNEPISTNLDIYATHQDGGATTNMTAANAATDTNPAASPDGKYLAWTAMTRPGYESDRQVLMLKELATGKLLPLTTKWDRSVDSINWAADSKSIYVTAEEVLDKPIFRIDLRGRVTRLTQHGHVTAVMPRLDGSIIYAMDNVMIPSDLYLRDKTGKVRQITNVNAEVAAALDPVAVQRFSFKGANGDDVWGQIIKPTSANAKLPVAFIVHGGPQGSFGDSWSYRWNPRVFAAQGYAVVTIDFHGSTGYGQAFTDSINKDWGDRPLEDLKLGLDAAAKFDNQIDADNACALGASYGGYMMNWIESHWRNKFKCIVQHDGVFDARAMAYETEELWFDEWEHGGPYYLVPQEFEKWNPVNYVDQWQTPMLVITSEKDFRIPYTQGLASFTALQRRGIPSKLLVFPDENHWVLQPKNSIQWHRTVFDWLNTYLRSSR